LLNTGFTIAAGTLITLAGVFSPKIKKMSCFEFDQPTEIKAQNNGQQVAGHDDRPNNFLARTNPDFGQSNK